MRRVSVITAMLSAMATGCSVSSQKTETGITGAVLQLDAGFQGWHSGTAVPLFRRAAQWWIDAGAEIHIDNWGYPVSLVDGSGWDQDQVGYGSPTGGIQISEPLLDKLASQPNGTAWILDTFAHEIGHVLGCHHLDDQASVMHGTLHPNDSGLTPQDADELEAVTVH